MSYFSRVTLKPQRLMSEKLAPLVCNDGYKTHQALWRLFDDDPNAERDFLFRRDDLFQGVRYFVVSQRQPDDNTGLWQIERKPYSPKVKAGQTLAFSLRVNPVVKRKGEDGKSRRHDVVMDEKRRTRQEDGTSKKHVMEIAQEAGSAWLARRSMSCGFSVNPSAVRIDSYHQHKSFKSGQKIAYSTLDMNGVLTVVEPAVFMRSLKKGIGPAKAFGCGLMLVRRT